MVQMWHTQTHLPDVCVRNIRINYTLTYTLKEVSVYWIRIRYTLTPTCKEVVECVSNDLPTPTAKVVCIEWLSNYIHIYP